MAQARSMYWGGGGGGGVVHHVTSQVNVLGGCTSWHKPGKCTGGCVHHGTSQVNVLGVYIMAQAR